MSASWLRILALMITSSWLFVGCNSAKKIDVGGVCVLNSDCNSSLVCSGGKCHDACHTSADCPPGQSCIIASDQSTVCQLPVETHCAYNSDCQPSLVCAADLKCRNQCQANVDCSSGQICTTTKTCAEPSQVDSNNNLFAPDGGVAGCPVGAETCPCYGNDTCNTGLACASHLCVSLGTGGASGAGGISATGGTRGTGGVSSTGGARSTGGTSGVACGSTGAPVGLCQFESGGPPACHSYVGAVGFNFGGVDFSASMSELATPLTVGGTNVPGSRGIIQLANGAIYTATWSPAQVNLVQASGSLSSFGEGFSAPHGLIQLFDGNLFIADPNGTNQVYATTGIKQRNFGASPYVWVTQTSSGEIWLSLNFNVVAFWQPLVRYCPNGTVSGQLQHPAFLNPIAVLELAEGGVVVEVFGTTYNGCAPGPNCMRARLVFFDAELTPRVFAVAPQGMILNADGSLSHPDMDGPHDLLQLPNGMIVVASYETSKLVRLNPDGSYVDTLTLGTSCVSNGCASARSGLALDSGGRMLTTSGTNQVRVIKFGCLSGYRQDSQGFCVPQT